MTESNIDDLWLPVDVRHVSRRRVRRHGRKYGEQTVRGDGALSGETALTMMRWCVTPPRTLCTLGSADTRCDSGFRVRYDSCLAGSCSVHIHPAAAAEILQAEAADRLQQRHHRARREEERWWWGLKCQIGDDVCVQSSNPGTVSDGQVRLSVTQQTPLPAVACIHTWRGRGSKPQKPLTHPAVWSRWGR